MSRNEPVREDSRSNEQDDWYEDAGGEGREISIAEAAAGHSAEDEDWAARESSGFDGRRVGMAAPPVDWEDEVPLRSSTPDAYAGLGDYEDQALPPMLVEDDRALVIADFLDDDRPPTDDMPNPVLEDLANVYTPPLDLPEAPPIGGLVDRFTPVSVGRSVDDRPIYSATPVDDLPDERPVLPPPVLPFQDEEEEEAEEREEVKRGIGWVAPVAGAAFVLVLLVVAVIVAVPFLRGGEARDAGPTVTVQPGPRPSATQSRGSPYASGADPLVSPEVSEPPAMSAARSDVKVAPASQEAPPSGVLGTLKVRSNRRVLVMVDGSAKDYSPLDLPVPAGQYLISAALPGRPDTQQTREVHVAPGSVEPVNFQF